MKAWRSRDKFQRVVEYALRKTDRMTTKTIRQYGRERTASVDWIFSTSQEVLYRDKGQWYPPEGADGSVRLMTGMVGSLVPFLAT